MKMTGCEFDRSVLSAHRSAVWTKSLRNHLDGCNDCKETLQLTQELKSFALWINPGQQSLPGHHIIFLRYEYSRRRQSCTLWEMITLGSMSLVAVAGTMSVLFWKSQTVKGFFSNVLSSAYQISSGSLSSNAVLIGSVSVLMVLFSLVQNYVLKDDR